MKSNTVSAARLAAGSLLMGGLGLRLDWEDDTNCRSHNPHTRYAKASDAIRTSAL